MKLIESIFPISVQYMLKCAQHIIQWHIVWDVLIWAYLSCPRFWGSAASKKCSNYQKKENFANNGANVSTGRAISSWDYTHRHGQVYWKFH